MLALSIALAVSVLLNGVLWFSASAGWAQNARSVAEADRLLARLMPHDREEG